VSRKICLLSDLEIKRLRLHGIKPSHSKHRHLNRNKFITLLREHLASHASHQRAAEKAAYHSRRARAKGSYGVWTAAQWEYLCAQFHGLCLKCGQAKELTPDHVMPLKLGGSNEIENIQPLCQSCNSAKGAKYVDYRNEPACMSVVRRRSEMSPPRHSAELPSPHPHPAA